MLKVLELFAGIGACSEALTNLGIEHEIVDAVEIDKYAIHSFNAIHGTNFDPQDITQWDKDIECDLIMHGSPCQDFSVAGLGKGGDKGSGTRSSLMYETLRIVEKLKPQYVIWENVKNLISKKHWHNFESYIRAMDELGYESQYRVLNAKDFGVPQNRERVFTVSIRKDIPSKEFYFPEPRPLDKRLKDILEPEVEEKFYLNTKQIEGMKVSKFNSANINNRVQGDVSSTLLARDYKDPKCVRVGGLYDSETTKHQAGSIYDPNGISATLSTMQGGNQEPLIVASRGRGEHNEQQLEPRKDGLTNTLTSVQKDNYVAEPQSALVQPVDRDYKKHGEERKTHVEMKKDGVSHALRTNGETLVALPGAYGRDFGSRGKVQDTDGVTSTLQAAMGEGGGNVPLVDAEYRIRKLTPKECWRLMGFKDSSFDKAKEAGISNSQLYKQAGNSICVSVLESILKNLL